MDNIPWEITVAVLGVVVPVIAAMYEFLIIGRKRLGYRVQMDTTATDAVHSQYAGVLQQLQQQDGTPLADPSFVLLRIENNGATHVDTHDYAVLDDDKVGIRVRFPGRRVAGMVVTELSDSFLRHSFGEDSGLSVRNGIIELPKVPLNRSAHYKVLAALERAPGSDRGREEFEDPEIVGGIKGGVGNGGIQETTSHTGTPRQAIALVCFLVLVIIAQLTLSLSNRDSVAPLDCATGKVTLTGSTAFEPVLREAADAYERTCPGSDFALETRGSTDGVRGLDRAGREKSSGSLDRLAFSDGAKGDGHPQLLPRPIAFSLFTLVINKEAGVQDLSLQQIRELYEGRISNWSEVGGNDRPVRIVSRYSDSGTRKTFQKRVLGGTWEPDSTSENCQERDPRRPTRDRALPAQLHRRRTERRRGHPGCHRLQRGGGRHGPTGCAARTHRRPSGHPGGRRPRGVPLLGDGVRLYVRGAPGRLAGGQLPALSDERGRKGHRALPRPPPLCGAAEPDAVPAVLTGGTAGPGGRPYGPHAVAGSLPGSIRCSAR